MNTISSICLSLFFTFQTLAAEKLSNGAPFFGAKDPSLPRSIFLLSFQGGPAAISPELQGTLLILMEALREGPQGQALADFKNELFKLGGEIDSSAEPNVFEVIVKTPPENTEKVLNLLKSTLNNPKLGQEDYNRHFGNVLAGLKTNFEEMRTVISYFSGRDFLGYPQQIRNSQTSPNTFQTITFEKFKATVPAILDYEKMFVSYIGQETVASAKKKFDAVFKENLNKPYKKWITEKPQVPELKETKYTLIDKPGATDNQILFLFPQAVKRDGVEWVESNVIMDTLGGGLHGQLSRTLRTERGLTYTAMSWFNANQLPYWIIWTFGGFEQTKGLLTGATEVVEKYKKGKLTALEFAESKSRLINDEKSALELPKDRLKAQSKLYANNLDLKFIDRYPHLLKDMSLDKANQFRKKLQSEKAMVYLMGDKSKLLPILESIGVKADSVRVFSISDIK